MTEKKEGRCFCGWAVEAAGWVRCPGCPYVGPSVAHTCITESPAGGQPSTSSEPALEQEQEPAPPTPAATSGAAQGRLLPGADHPAWEAVPLHLCQQLRGPAYELVSPARGQLAARENRPVLSAVRAASRMRMTGAHWTLLLTTSRKTFGGPSSKRAQALYAVLGQVAAQHAALKFD